jgi:LysM repeat protein
MKWRHWAVLIILVLLNYIIFSTALTKLAEQRLPDPRPTRTPQPTFASLEPTPLAWKVLPTSTPLPTRTPFTPVPTQAVSVTVEITPSVQVTVTATGENTTAKTPLPPTATASAAPAASNTPAPPTATVSGNTVTHTVQRGETLSAIAAAYGVTVQAIVDANGLTDPGHIVTGQVLIIPAPGGNPPTAAAPSATAKPAATKPPTPKPTPKPPTATPQPTVVSLQFTADVIWDHWVAPNCSGPAIAKESIIRNTGGGAVDGVRIEVDCYGNKWLSHPSGNPGEYEAGHYDFVFGQTTPQDWICTARVFDLNGQPVASSEVVSIHFDTNDCKPEGNGHQVAIVNWTKHW